MTLRGIREPVSLEQALCRSLAEMRMATAEADRSDYLGSWTAELLDKHPLIYVAVLRERQTLAWVLEPEGDEGVLSAGVSDLTADAQLVIKGKALADVAGDVSWLVKEATGTHLTSYCPVPQGAVRRCGMRHRPSCGTRDRMLPQSKGVGPPVG
jgi:hypothetical protein